MVVLFHEMSHGLMTLATGGEVRSITIDAGEGGSCESYGGVGVLIVSAGYLGSMFFGGLILYLSRFRSCAAGVYVLLTLLLAASIFTVLHEPYTRKFATGLAGAFIVMGLLVPQFLSAFFLRALGTVSCLYVMFDIYSDILADDRPAHAAANDAAAFSQLTGISAQAVGALWLLVSVVYFFAVLKIIIWRTTPESTPPAGSIASVPA